MPKIGQPLWTPTAARAQATAMARFGDVARRDNTLADGYDALHAWSTSNLSGFWGQVWDFCGVVGDRGGSVFRAGASMPAGQFFPDTRLSVAENFLRGSGEALVAIDEAGNRRTRSFTELAERVARLAGALADLGVQPGDRVAAWLPNAIEAVEVMLAATSIGAVFSSSSPDFGANGVLDRFGQIEPKVLVAVDGYRYNGKDFDCLERLETIVAGLPTVVATLLVANVRASDRAVSQYRDYESVVEGGRPVAPQRFAFDHPWYVLYSSGTTGVPKCIVHRTGGVLLQHMKEHQLHCDVQPGDRVLYFTTTGWMMWNWLVSVLASGATAILFDGAPTAPGMARLFDIVDDESVTLLGVSAKYIDSVRKAELRPRDTHALTTLRTMCSTGSPLSPEGFEWVYDAVKSDLHLASISGGTDLCGCFVGGDPTRPVWSGEIQGPMLGMATDVADERGVSMRDRPLTPGELVCRTPFPSMPLGFWGDGSTGAPNPHAPGPKFTAAYFERFDGMWAQGDFASWTEHGGMVIHGRSDTTLNPGGVRIGTAEIYRVVEQHPQIVESCVFGQDHDNDVRVVLLVRLAEGGTLTDDMVQDVKARIRKACTPRHVPAIVLQVNDLPRTRSNKLVELALADAVNGRPVRNSEAIANPECLWVIAAMPELRR
jgi:acetoacetyl-CoA synthetase